MRIITIEIPSEALPSQGGIPEPLVPRRFWHLAALHPRPHESQDAWFLLSLFPLWNTYQIGKDGSPPRIKHLSQPSRTAVLIECILYGNGDYGQTEPAGLNRVSLLIDPRGSGRIQRLAPSAGSMMERVVTSSASPSFGHTPPHLADG